MVRKYPYIGDDGSLVLRAHLVISAQEITLRVTTSGGPGGQHANRALTRVVATFDVASSTSLNDSQRERLLELAGPVVRTSAGRFRSQGMNRTAALTQLATRLSQGLEYPTPRRATRPTRASQTRRVDDKKARGRTKERRRHADDD